MNYSNEMIKHQLNHRTIREFEDRNIPKDMFETLMEVARRTASSVGMQACSIIRVTDINIRKEIADICTQEYVARAPELLIFIVDQYRNKEIAREKKASLDYAGDMDRFFSSFTDACIMAQNVVNAAESMELGTVYLGSILNDSEKICKLLKLPELTFPVVGLGIGYPNQNPQLKPRMKMELRLFENEYKKYDKYLDEIKDYDQEMESYYDLRQTNKRMDCFSDQVISRLNHLIPKRQKIVSSIVKQGFDLKL